MSMAHRDGRATDHECARSQLQRMPGHVDSDRPSSVPRLVQHWQATVRRCNISTTATATARRSAKFKFEAVVRQGPSLTVVVLLHLDLHGLYQSQICRFAGIVPAAGGSSRPRPRGPRLGARTFGPFGTVATVILALRPKMRSLLPLARRVVTRVQSIVPVRGKFMC